MSHSLVRIATQRNRGIQEPAAAAGIARGVVQTWDRSAPAEGPETELPVAMEDYIKRK